MSKKDFVPLYAQKYINCCCGIGEQYDPTCFQEDHPTYRSCFGSIHVKYSAIILATFKLIILTAILIYIFVRSDDDLLRLFGLFGFLVAGLSNILLIAGVHARRYVFLIPYFTACILFIFVLVLQLFYSFMETANAKNSLEIDSLVWNICLLAITMFEIYTLTIVWRVFVYICDYNMECRLKQLRRCDHENHSPSSDNYLSSNQLVGTVNRITIGNEESDSSEGE